LPCRLACAHGSAQAASVDVEVQGQDGKPLADAVVFLESRRRAAAVPVPGHRDRAGRQAFTQRVTVVPVGSAVAFPNRDKVRHHVYSFSPAKTFDLKLYIGTPANPVVFDKAGIAVLGCNIHDTMAGLGGGGGHALLRPHRRQRPRAAGRRATRQLPAAQLAPRPAARRARRPTRR
jgi:plastocyanin